MALVLKDRVKETSVSTGTGAIALDGATGAFQPFSTIGNGNTTYYAIVGQTTTEWEVGIGTYTLSTDTLSRDTILASSNSNTIVTFSAGTKDVFITYPSEKGVWVDASGTSNYAATIGSTAVNLGTTVTTLAGLTSVTVTQDPSVALDLATKQYVDTLVSSGITYHAPVKYEVPDTTGNLTATYNNGTSGVGATLTNAGTQVAFTPDGVVASVNDRVLVYNQTNAFENGVYTVTTVGSGSTNWVLTRATDADTYGLKDPDALGNGDAFFVTSGNTGAGETYVCNTVGVITFGTTAISFEQISSSQVYNAGTGLTLSPATTFNIANTTVTAASYGAASKTLTATVNAQGQLTALADTDIAIAMSQVTSGTLAATQGGTGQSSYSIGDILYADTTTSLARLADVATGNALISGGLNAPPAWGKIALASAVSGTLGIANGGTGQTTANAAFNALAPSQTSNSGKYLTTDGTNTSWGTVTQTTFSAGTTGFTPATATSGAVTLAGTLNIANGGTGATTRQEAIDALAGATTSGFYLRGNGTDVVMASIVAGDVPTLNQNTTGNAATATLATTATTATNLAGGSAGTIPYQSAAGTTVQLTAGTSGYILQSNGAAAPSWVVKPTGTVTSVSGGSYLTGGTITTSGTLAVDATTTNTASKVVARDASGNFSAGTITAALSGNATTATTATNQSGGTVSASTATVTPNTTGVSTGLTVVNGDITTYRTGGTTGVIYLSNSGTRYLYWDGTNYNMPGGNLIANITGNVTGSSGSCTGNAATATSAGSITGFNNPTTAATGNTIVYRDGSGYIFGTYFNQSSGNSENPAVSQVMVTNGSDSYLRKSSIASFTTYLSGTAASLTAGAATALSTATGSAPSYSARAWVSFNGQGTIAIRASGNVSSITDVGTGSYRINFTTAMPDINYVFAGNGQGASSGSLGCNTIPFVSNSPASLVNPTTTSVNFTTWVFNYSGTFDPAFVTAAIFR